MKKRVIIRRKNIYKMLVLICMFLIIVFGVFFTKEINGDSKNSGKITLRFHYTRNDEAYDKWKLWVWEDNKGGKDYDFEKTDGGDAYSCVTVDNKSLKAGYLIHTKDWEKDVAVDRYVDISDVASGTIDIYLSQGEEKVEIEKRQDVVNGAKVVETEYDGEYEIIVKLSDKVTDFDEIEVRSTKEETVELYSIEEEEELYIITVEQPLILTQSYCLWYHKVPYIIDMPNIYSTEEFEKEYTYTGGDLGADWAEEKTVFKVWAPTADSVKLCLYESGMSDADDMLDEVEMQKGDNGVWFAEKQGNQNGVYYTYKVAVNNEEVEACDPYARATGINGERAMVIDMLSTNPEGWEYDVNPNKGADITDAIIYELGVRDFSINASSGISEENRGKYLAFTETGTKNQEGEVTGIDYLKSLGVTHVQIMPIQDFGYVDEENPSYNWGYATQNYNVPDGAYTSNPYDGEVRIRETKEMIQALHENGMSVVIDVVYNHVYDASEYCFNKIVPDYFTRVNARGEYSNGSQCGNDTASERSMVRKYIVDSVIYWIEEYHVDGFRFDLAGLLDVETINEIVRRVKEIDPSIILYGEGWNMSTISTKPDTTFAVQTSAGQTTGFGYFDDRIRYRIKGKPNDNTTGYITGVNNVDEMKLSIKADAGWSNNPQQIINYVSCHDDATLWDKVRTCAVGTYEEQIRQNNLASAIILSSQGVSFLHAGDELLRSKVDESGKVVHNSYESPDSVNSIRWDSLSQDEIKRVMKYYEGLIAFRKEHKALRMNTREEIEKNIYFRENLPENVIAYVIDASNVEGETVEKIFISFNPNPYPVEIELPEGDWSICVNGESSGVNVIENVRGTIVLDSISAYMMIQ